jgi:hypothetical protein
MSVLARKVLLLTASYQPEGVIDVVRAFLLVWKGSAQTVEVDPDLVLRSQHATHEVPSVIRLVHC